MNLRQANKISRRQAWAWIKDEPSPYSSRRHTVNRVMFTKVRRRRLKAAALEQRHACTFCGRQRYRPSDADKPCTFPGCPSHVHDSPHPHAKKSGVRP